MSPFAEFAALAALSTSAGVTTMLVTAEAVPTDGSVAAYLLGGGATVVLAGIVGEVARRLLNGSLVPRVVRDSEVEAGSAVQAAGQREDRVMSAVESLSTSASDVRKVAEDLRLHNERLASDLAKVAHEQTRALSQVVEDLRDEVRELRRGGKL